MVTGPARLDLDRHRDLGDLLGTTFRLFAAHLAVFLSLALLIVAPIVIAVDGVWGRGLADGPDANVPAAQLTSVVLRAFVATPLVTALNVAVVQGLARGEEPAVGRALARTADRFVPVLLTVALYTLAVAGGMLLLIVPGVWLAVRLYLGAQAAVIDRLGPLPALRRSADLVHGSWWRTFGLLIASGLVFGIISAALAGLAGVSDDGVVYIVLFILAQTVGLSLSAIFGTLVFFDLRARKEVPWQGTGLIEPESPERPLSGRS